MVVIHKEDDMMRKKLSEHKRKKEPTLYTFPVDYEIKWLFRLL